MQASEIAEGDRRFQRLIHTLPWHPSLAFADSALARPGHMVH